MIFQGFFQKSGIFVVCWSFSQLGVKTGQLKCWGKNRIRPKIPSTDKNLRYTNVSTSLLYQEKSVSNCKYFQLDMVKWSLLNCVGGVGVWVEWVKKIFVWIQTFFHGLFFLHMGQNFCVVYFFLRGLII